jgi:hypothetical protein
MEGILDEIISLFKAEPTIIIHSDSSRFGGKNFIQKTKKLEPWVCLHRDIEVNRPTAGHHPATVSNFLGVLLLSPRI